MFPKIDLLLPILDPKIDTTPPPYNYYYLSVTLRPSRVGIMPRGSIKVKIDVTH